jgi:hypothetical protein
MMRRADPLWEVKPFYMAPPRNYAIDQQAPNLFRLAKCVFRPPIPALRPITGAGVLRTGIGR